MLNEINLSDISLDDTVVADNKGTRAKTVMVSIFLSLSSFGILLGENMGSF